MKRKSQQDGAFNPVSFNVGLARQVLGRKRPAAEDSRESTGTEAVVVSPTVTVPVDKVEHETHDSGRAAEAEKPNTAHSANGTTADRDEPEAKPADETPSAVATPKPAPRSPAKSSRKPSIRSGPAADRPAPRLTSRRGPAVEDASSNTFRGGPRQDLRIPLDERRRDDLGDLVRQLNRRLRSRLPEAVTFRALLTVMLAAQDRILDAANGAAIGRTPARQDILAATEAERDVALLLADALASVDGRDLERMYDEQLADLRAAGEGELALAA